MQQQLEVVTNLSFWLIASSICDYASHFLVSTEYIISINFVLYSIKGYDRLQPYGLARIAYFLCKFPWNWRPVTKKIRRLINNRDQSPL